MTPLRFPAPSAGRVDLLIIAGEHSGDEQAARLLRALLERRPGAAVCALGGPVLASAGAQLLYDLTSSSTIGYLDVLRKYFSFYRPLFRETLRWIGEHRPRAVCFVDYGGFNLRMAEAMRAQGLSEKGGGKIKTLYFISPQIWASRSGRRFSLARSLDAMAVIFPFESKAYADTGLSVDFVGHPFTAPDYRTPVAYDPDGPILLLPGSRRKPVERIFPSLLAAHRAFGERPAVVPYPSEEIAGILRAFLTEADRDRVRLVSVGSSGTLGGSAALTSSGTMSLNCALAGIPGAIAYRADPITYFLGRWLVRIPYLGLANILLGELMYPEYIQGAARPDALAAELKACLHDPARMTRTQGQSARLRALLGQPAGAAPGDWLDRKLG